MSTRIDSGAKGRGSASGAGGNTERPAVDLDRLAEALHRGAIGLLRRVKIADEETGVSPPRLSALSVLVFGGAQSLGSLARAEGVKPPTMSKLVGELEAEGLVAKASDPKDARGLLITATPRGRKVMLAGRDRRLSLLKLQLDQLTLAERQALARAAPALAKIAGR